MAGSTNGAVAQLGERVVRNDEAVGSIPISSTNTAKASDSDSNMKSRRFPDNLPAGWHDLLKEEASKDYFQKLTAFLKEEYKSGQTIFPAKENILRALQLVDYNDVRVVILGQDPYHGPRQAVGLSFAVPNDLSPKPPSLQNIFKEIQSDLHTELDFKKTDLTGWAAQGVLLLNTVLTVRKGQAFSHRDRGWEAFTDRVIELLDKREEPIVFLLWGSPARQKKILIRNSRHLILEAMHPSPFSADKGFFGCKHFSKTNAFLNKIGKKPIQWQHVSE